MGRPSDKPFIDYNQMLKIFKERNINVNDKENTIFLLRNIQYYNLINNYKKIFVVIDESGNYTDDYQNVDFESIVRIYDFDKELGNILFKYIMIFEESLKSILSYFIAETYGYLESDYLSETCYLKGNRLIDSSRTVQTDSKGNNLHDRDKLLDKLNKKIKNSHSESIRHYKSEYGNVPPWILMNDLTLGEIINWLKLCKTISKNGVEHNIKEKVLSHFIDMEKLSEYDDSASLFYTSLYVVLEYRNIITHCGRVCQHENKRSQNPNLLYKYIGIYSVSMKNSTFGRNNFFGLIYSLIIVLTNRSTVKSKFINEIMSLFKELSESDEHIYESLLNRSDLKQHHIDRLSEEM